MTRFAVISAILNTGVYEALGQSPPPGRILYQLFRSYKDEVYLLFKPLAFGNIANNMHYPYKSSLFAIHRRGGAKIRSVIYANIAVMSCSVFLNEGHRPTSASFCR